MESDSTNHKKEIITVVIALVVIAGIIVAVTLSSKKDSTANTSNTTTSQTTDTNAKTTGTYKDGTYSQTASFNTPGGTDEITVSVTLKDNVVTDTSATASATDSESKEYDNDFLNAYKKLVVGKNVNDISLSRVSGSSLTPQGFNDALAQIKQQATTAS